jgi:SAM-dependent methyltransferase
LCSNKPTISNCPVCKSFDFERFIETNALMHKKNDEIYFFNKCSYCESVFLENPVHESDLNAYYTDNYLPYQGPEAWGIYKNFVNKSQENLDLQRMKLVAKFIKKNNNISFLDIGCGNPSFLSVINQRLKAKCTGIDFSDKGWNDKLFDKLELIQTSIASFQPKKEFDVVTLWHYLEHDYNLSETIEKIHKCLKIDGKLFIEVPNYISLTAKIQGKYWQGWHSPRHLTLFSKKGFEQLFSSDKWNIVAYKKYGTLDAFTLWWLGKMEKDKIDWSSKMEIRFWKLVFLKIITFPIFMLEKFIPMGIQIIIVEKK